MGGKISSPPDIVSIAGVHKKGKRKFSKPYNRPGRVGPLAIRRPGDLDEVEREQRMARAVKDVWYGKTHRKSFARTDEILEMPYLLEIQKKSYKWFLETGLQEVFNDVDSITD